MIWYAHHTTSHHIMPNLTYTTNGTTHTIPYTRHNFPAGKFKELGGGDVQFLVSPEQDVTRDALVEMLKVWMGFCDQHEVKWWAHSGTLIGALRHQGLIPWDNDIDLGITFHDYKRIREITGPEYEVEFVTGYVLVKAVAGYRVQRVGHVLPFMDIFACDAMPEYPSRSHYAGPIARRTDGTYIRSFYCAEFFHKEWIDIADLDTTVPFPTLPFEGIDIPVPHNALEIAQRHYGADVMTYMYYSDVTNGFGHSDMIFELTRLERYIDLIARFTYATGLDVMTDDASRDYQLNLTGLIGLHLLYLTEKEFPDTASIDKVLADMKNDWVAYVTKRLLRMI
jgi:hypothetical protein